MCSTQYIGCVVIVIAVFRLGPANGRKKRREERARDHVLSPGTQIQLATAIWEISQSPEKAACLQMSQLTGHLVSKHRLSYQPIGYDLC